MTTTKCYYVYTATDNDNNIVYVGSGKGSRIKHVNSGRSHSKLINSHVLTVGPLKVSKIADSLTNRESLLLEQEYITTINPKYNLSKRVAPRKEWVSVFTNKPYVDLDVANVGWNNIFDDPCSYYIEGDLESIANYQMFIVDKRKQQELEFPSDRFTDLHKERERFTWEGIIDAH